MSSAQLATGDDGSRGLSGPLMMAMCLILDSAALFGGTDGRETSYFLGEGLTHDHWQLQEVGTTRQVHNPFLPVRLRLTSNQPEQLAWRLLAGETLFAESC